MFVSSEIIKLMETGFDIVEPQVGLPPFFRFRKPGASVVATDDKYYPTEELTKEERRHALVLLAEQKLPEGSVFVMAPRPKQPDKIGEDYPAFDVVPNPDEDDGRIVNEFRELEGLERGAKIVEALIKNQEHYEEADIEIVALPGNASSPVGTAAFAKALAKMYQKKVASIVVGQGVLDTWMESLSGGMLMAPRAFALQALNPLLEITLRFVPGAQIGAKLYINELLDVMPEAATLYALLKARLVDGQFKNLKMIVSHSKGNWALLVALLAFELELIDAAKKCRESSKDTRPIKIVTFCNPVALPDMEGDMKAFFQYFQFVGEVDNLAHFCSLRSWMLHLFGEKKLDPISPDFNPEYGPRDRMVASSGHHLVAHGKPDFFPYHMPIKAILDRIQPQPAFSPDS